ncbi:hypothetical protein OG474_20265 [Kribbella sp. NBC_01505]|uniref:hypothetical protein n=1 Tax=Kribbella sp. NBC_01505 TaxID=2903580 RepID=UPI0038641D7A
MGVDVLLLRVDRAGTSPKRRRLVQLAVLGDPDDVFAGLCARSDLPMLGRVDPYGDLVLTTSEMPQFLAELAAEHAREPQELLTGIRQLAERCAAEPGTELHLVGD